MVCSSNQKSIGQLPVNIHWGYGHNGRGLLGFSESPENTVIILFLDFRLIPSYAEAKMKTLASRRPVHWLFAGLQAISAASSVVTAICFCD